MFFRLLKKKKISNAFIGKKINLFNAFIPCVNLCTSLIYWEVIMFSVDWIFLGLGAIPLLITKKSQESSSCHYKYTFGRIQLYLMQVQNIKKIYSKSWRCCSKFMLLTYHQHNLYISTQLTFEDHVYHLLTSVSCII
jgi:hypothetical protein